MIQRFGMNVAVLCVLTFERCLEVVWDELLVVVLCAGFFVAGLAQIGTHFLKRWISMKYMRALEVDLFKLVEGSGTLKVA